MAKGAGDGPPQQEALKQMVVPVDDLFPNPWNVNQMSPEMFEKERASIRKFGFVDPCLVRPHPWETGRWQIIDGEHRWRGAKAEGYTQIPVTVIKVDDAEAKQLSIVLNETRGQADQAKLGALLAELRQDVEEDSLREVMPFDRGRFDELIGELEGEKLDYDELDQMKPQPKGGERYVERVFRMPAEVAEVVDEATQKIQAEEQLDHDWQALEVMAANVMAS